MKIKRKTFKADVPTMAMGDITFNLLIFFVILARAQDDSHLQWQAAAGEELESAGRAQVSVLVDVENKLYLNGQEIGISQLSGEIASLLGDKQPGDRTVLLKIHRETTALRFEPIIEAVSEAGGELVHVLQEERRE